MNWGIFGWGYGAVLDTYRRRIKYGRGASKVNFEAVVLGTTDNTTGMLRSQGGAAPALSYADLVLQVPYIAGRRGQSPLAFGAVSLTIPDGTMQGGNRRGQRAIDLQCLRASPVQVASGLESMILGGASNRADANYSAVLGWQASASNVGTVAIGYGAVADGQYCIAMGTYASANQVNRTLTFSGSQRAGAGDRNVRVVMPQMQVTTNATPTILTTDAAAASAATTWSLPNNRAASFFGHITARNTATGDMIAWEVKCAFKRGANAAATALVGVPTVTVIANDAALAACTLAITANTTHGALNITATGLAATTLAWNGVLYGPENG